MTEPAHKIPPETGPPLPKPVLLAQTWRDVLFVHWPVEPESVADLVPGGTRPDAFDGHTYVGVVGFTVPSTRLGGAVHVGSMHELNVRLYSVADDGRQGVVFLSMDVNRIDMVVAARVLPRLPYMWSHLERTRNTPTLTGIELRRRLPSQLTARVEIDVGEPLPQPSPLDIFLTARWELHTRTFAGTARIPVTHPPWLLHRARLTHFDYELLTAAGVPARRGEPVGVLWSPGLEAQIGRPSPLRNGTPAS